jgi:3-deoxy-D-manno-octulosonic-acid transferase
MMRLYNAALFPLRLAFSVWGTWRSLDPEAAVRWSERLARQLPRMAPGGIWIHGASVGEARIAAALAAELKSARPRRPLALSAVTPTGRSQLPAPPLVDAAFYMPLDFSGFPQRILERIRPGVLTLIETELWPNLLSEAYTQRVPVVVVNARLSAGRMTTYRRFRALYRPLLERLSAVGAQSAADGDRFAALGVPRDRIQITGNVKYDLQVDDAGPEAIRDELGLERTRPVLVAGSTGVGEDAAVLAAVARIRERHPELLLILAPRHPERADEVARLVQQTDLRLRRWSDQPSARETDVLLVDQVGQLTRLYSVAGVAFVGGSLVPLGGHNVLEPAAAGVPVLFGPHTHSVAEPAAELVRRGGAIRVQDAAELGRVVTELLSDHARRDEMIRAAAGVLRENRGALRRSVQLIETALASDRGVHAERR